MNSENKSSCETCQGVFSNDHELSMHDCVEIKKEPQDLKQGYYNTGWFKNNIWACWSCIRYSKRISQT